MHEKSIDLLNQAIADELSAIHQYMYFHFHCDDQGYGPLADLFRTIAITEMMHAERIGERVLFLGGDVEMMASAEVKKIQSVPEILEAAKGMEEAAVVMYNRFAGECAGHGDSVTKKLFEDLIVDEEGHYDQFDTQAGHVKKFGEQYLALQTMEKPAEGA